MAKIQQSKLVNQKHLARQQREALQTRNIVIASVAVIVTIVVLFAGGLINQFVLQPNRTIAEVNGDKIALREFEINVRYQRARIIENYQQLAQYFGDNEQFQQQVQQTLANVQGIGQNVLDDLIEDRLIRQEAKRRGITVSAAEVDQELQEAFGYYPDGHPTATATNEPWPTSTLTAFQQTVTAPTATTVPTITLPTATATLAPSPTASLELTPTVTATPYTAAAFKENFQAQLSIYKEATGMSEKDFRRIVETQLYREKVQEAVLAETIIATEEEQIWARHILIADPITATLVLDEINNGGDFATLAEQYSNDPGSSFNGGDLGWFGPGKMEAEFEQAAWNLKTGEVSGLVATSYGYHIIQLLGKETRPLDDSAYQQNRETKFTEWLAAQRKQAEDALKLIIQDFWTSVIPTTP